eukprot:scaffold415_cov362-Prasinococcus_capsulatus_cf.AAC.6
MRAPHVRGRTAGGIGTPSRAVEAACHCLLAHVWLIVVPRGRLPCPASQRRLALGGGQRRRVREHHLLERVGRGHADRAGRAAGALSGTHARRSLLLLIRANSSDVPMLAPQVDSQGRRYEDYGDAGPLAYVELTREWVTAFDRQQQRAPSPRVEL